MRGTENYDYAQTLIEVATEANDIGHTDRADFLIAKAEVHAQLAVAGGLAALIAECKRGTTVVVNKVETRPSPLDLEQRRTTSGIGSGPR